MACKQTIFSKNISKESHCCMQLFFTFAKESGGLKEKGTRWFLNFLGSVQNVIFGFFAVEKFIKFSFRVLEIFKISRKSTCKIQIALRLNRWSWNFRVKWGLLRSNLRFQSQNSFLMTHSRMSHENNHGVKFDFRSVRVKWGHFYNRLI